MERVPKGIYSQEFREQAVKLVLEEGLTITAVARQLSMPAKTLGCWVSAVRCGQVQAVGGRSAEKGAQERELAQLRRELIATRMERDFLKKCAAYFAKAQR